LQQLARALKRHITTGPWYWLGEIGNGGFHFESRSAKVARRL
jgi:hypothetical protein